MVMKCVEGIAVIALLLLASADWEPLIQLLTASL